MNKSSFSLSFLALCAMASSAASQVPTAPWTEEIRPDFRNVRGLNYLAVYDGIPNCAGIPAVDCELSSTSFWLFYDGFNNGVNAGPRAMQVRDQLLMMKGIGVNSIRVWMSFPLWKLHEDFSGNTLINPFGGNDFVRKIGDFMQLCESVNMHVMPVFWGPGGTPAQDTFARFARGGAGALQTTNFPNTGAPASQLFSPLGRGDFDVHWSTGAPISPVDAVQAITSLSTRGWHGNPGMARLTDWQTQFGTSGVDGTEIYDYIKIIVHTLQNSEALLMWDVMNEPPFTGPYNFLIEETIRVLNVVSAVDVPITVGAGAPNFGWNPGPNAPLTHSLPASGAIDVISCHPYHIVLGDNVQRWVENSAGLHVDPVTSLPVHGFDQPVLITEIGNPLERMPYSDAINMCLNLDRPDLGPDEKGVGFMIWATMLAPNVPLDEGEGIFYLDGKVRNVAACEAFIEAAVAQGISRSDLALPDDRPVVNAPGTSPQNQFIDQLPVTVGYDDVDYTAEVLSFPAPTVAQISSDVGRWANRLISSESVYGNLFFTMIIVDELYSSALPAPSYVTARPVRDLWLGAWVGALPFFPDLTNPSHIRSRFQMLELLSTNVYGELATVQPSALSADPGIREFDTYESFRSNLIKDGSADLYRHRPHEILTNRANARMLTGWTDTIGDPIRVQNATERYDVSLIMRPTLSPPGNHRYFEGGAAGAPTRTLVQDRVIWDLVPMIAAGRVGFELQGEFQAGLASADAQLLVEFLDATGNTVGAIQTVGVGSAVGAWTGDLLRGLVPVSATNVHFELELPAGSRADDLSFQLIEILGDNLIRNPESELVQSNDPSDLTDMSVPLWTDTSNFIISQDYAVPPTSPADAGLSRFHGGGGWTSNTVEVITQSIPIDHAQTLVSGGLVSFALSGWFGSESGTDTAELSLQFLDAAGTAIGTPVVIGGTIGGLLQAVTSGPVPSAARTAALELRFTNVDGGTECAGVADLLELLLQ